MRTSIINNNNNIDISWNESKLLLNNNTFYIVHRNGPTVLNVRNENDEIYRVIIGKPHSCSCKKDNNIFCVHILFVLLKVFRIPEDHPYAKKISLTDSEIDITLIGDFGGRPKPTILRKEKKQKITTKSNENLPEETVERQPMDDENPDICPICQDDMTKDDALTWCRKGCGNNIHAKCMKLYAQYKTTNSTNILCPLCREDWGTNALQILNDDCKGRASLKKACSTVQCYACTFQIRGDFYRCVECSLKSYENLIQSTLANQLQNNDIIQTQQWSGKIQPIDFCQRCFQNITREHAKHHFLTSSSTELLSDFQWNNAKNPRAPQQLLDERVLNSLQNREFNDSDYDMLLNLDKPQNITVQKVLIDSLNIYTPPINDNSILCWCKKNNNDENNKIHILPCNHKVHEFCLSTLLDEAISEGCWKLDEIKCGHINCKIHLFKGISRRRYKPKKNNEENNNVNGEKEGEKLSSMIIDSNKKTDIGQSLLTGISGISLSGNNNNNSNVNNNNNNNGTIIRTQQSQKLRRNTSLKSVLQNKQENTIQPIGNLCIGNRLTQEDESTARPPLAISSTRNQGVTRRGLALTNGKKLRSMSDDDEIIDIQLNSSIVSEGVQLRTTLNNDSTLSSSSTPSTAIRKNKIPIRKQLSENMNKLNMNDLNDHLQNSVISLNRISLNQQQSNNNSNNNNNNDNNNSNFGIGIGIGAVNRNSNDLLSRPPNYQMKGKRIKSSPASLLVEKRRLSAQSNSNITSEPISMLDNSMDNLQNCFHVTHHQGI